MAPVFSLVLDKDVDENLANLYPELYRELTSGSSLSYKTFFIWVFVSIYQGGMIQGLSQILTEVDGPKMVAVSFTVLVLNELCMVAFEITTWHPVMVGSLVGTLLLYLGSIPFLGGYFDLHFILTWYVPLPAPQRANTNYVSGASYGALQLSQPCRSSHHMQGSSSGVRSSRLRTERYRGSDASGIVLP